MKRPALAILALLIGASPALAFSWPWEQPRRVHHRSHQHPAHPHPRHHARQPQAKPAAPDCAQIRKDVQVMEPAQLERALRASSAATREIITKCLKEPPP
jgi:hypothetical protein